MTALLLALVLLLLVLGSSIVAVALFEMERREDLGHVSSGWMHRNGIRRF